MGSFVQFSWELQLMDFKRYLATKSVARIQEEAMQSKLLRTLGPWNLVSLGIGCIIGTGIFVLTGQAAANYAGPAIIISFVISGTACAFAGLCYAELASTLPISGSAYTYTYATMGEIFAWIMGLLLILEYGVAASTVAVGWSGYMVSLLNQFGLHIPAVLTSAYGQSVHLANGRTASALFNMPAMLGALAVMLLLVRGVSESATVNNIIVFIKVSVVVAFVAIGVSYINPANWVPFIPPVAQISNGGAMHQAFGFDGVLRAASIVFFAYVGFEAVSTAAQETRNPQRNMPIGILGSLIICTILYMLTSAVLTGVVPYAQLNVPDPMAVAADHMGLGWFSTFVKLGALMGMTSVMLVLMYGQTRIFYIMSRDGLMPPLFSRVHSRFHTPWINTLLVGVIIAIASALTPLSVLGDMVSFGTLMAFVMVCYSVIYLRRRHAELHRPFRTPFYPWVPILGMLSCFGLIMTFEASYFRMIGLWLAAGMLFYIFYGRHHSRLIHEEKPLPADQDFVKQEHEIQVD
jgi:basic amino acid/polyamine antiporter, APA family